MVPAAPSPDRADAIAIWRAGVDAVRADRLVRAALRVEGRNLVVATERVPLDAIDRIAVLGAGKAGAAMATAVEAALGPALLREKRVRGWVNVPDRTVRPLAAIRLYGSRSANDNRPTAEGLDGAQRVLVIARSLGPRDMALCLVSGGGSSLLPTPADGVSLEDKQRVTSLLLDGGATIDEMNAVRKHLSRIKGGGLAQACGAARVVTLVISDVVGNPLDVIASGPTAPDPTTYADALAVLDRLGLRAAAPPTVVHHLEEGVAGRRPETPKWLPDTVVNAVIGDNATARRAAADEARARGYDVVDLGEITGDTQEAARRLAVEVAARRGARVCLVSGGETTVALPPEHGLGGRNQEMVLATMHALGLDGMSGAVLLAAGTDGEDGPTDAAGAIADEELARAAHDRGLDAADYLRRHDAWHFFDALGGLVRTGPTDTNVTDLRVFLTDGGPS